MLWENFIFTKSEDATFFFFIPPPTEAVCLYYIDIHSTKAWGNGIELLIKFNGIFLGSGRKVLDRTTASVSDSTFQRIENSYF